MSAKSGLRVWVGFTVGVAVGSNVGVGVRVRVGVGLAVRVAARVAVGCRVGEAIVGLRTVGVCVCISSGSADRQAVNSVAHRIASAVSHRALCVSSMTSIVAPVAKPDKHAGAS